MSDILCHSYLRLSQQSTTSSHTKRNRLYHIYENNAIGLVKITLTGRGYATKVQLDDSVLNDKETLEDLITVAISDARERADNYMETEMEKFEISPKIKYVYQDLHLVIESLTIDELFEQYKKCLERNVYVSLIHDTFQVFLQGNRLFRFAYIEQLIN